MEKVEEESSVSTRHLERALDIPKTIVNYILKEQLLYPYHVQKIQELLPIDTSMRLKICEFIRTKRICDKNNKEKILFINEACFTRSGVTNMHKEHVYADENPYVIKVAHCQYNFKRNVWAFIIDRYFIGPVVNPDRINEDIYLNFLQTE